MPTLIQIAIVEDQRDVREGLRFMLHHSAGFRCVAACGSAEEALRVLPASRPDVILMDLQLPGLSGIECIRRLRVTLPNVPVAMLTVFEDDDKVFEALRAGATGYLLKSTPPDKLVDAVRELHAGGSPMSGQIARKVIRELVEGGPSRAPAGPPLPDLSPRERAILDLLAKGHRYKEVADRLGISVDTVRTHVRHIYAKLEVHSRAEAMLKVMHAGNKPPACG